MADGVTKFESLFERFYRRIEKDEDFFNYYNVEVSEAVQLAHDRAKGCLIDALDTISSIGDLDVDFDDYDDDTEVLNFKITPIERKLIIELMFQVYMERDLPMLHAFEINFTPSDLNVFSPANERNSYKNFCQQLHDNNEVLIDNYKNRDRLTGKLKQAINYVSYSDL